MNFKTTVKKGFFASCILLFAGFSPTSEHKKVQGSPLVNISGELIAYGASHPVEWITIDGAYEDIPVFQEPPAADINPNIATTRLQLAAVQRITTVSTKGTSLDSKNNTFVPTIVNFAGTDYIKINVYSNGASEASPYLIEKKTHVICQARPSGSGQRHEFSFQAIQELIINSVTVPSRISPQEHFSHSLTSASQYGSNVYNALTLSLKNFFNGVNSMVHYLWT